MKENCPGDCIKAIPFPKEIKNRSGLQRIDYRIGTYAEIREWLLRNLSKDKLFKTWTHFEPDDPGIALLEGVSIISDILTFYQELYANEAYLRTAKWKESISDLVRLLGYNLSPGLGGKGKFAFEIKNDKPVFIPTGFPLQLQLEGLEQPVDFETSEELTAIPSLSKFHLYHLITEPEISTETTEFRIIGNNNDVPDISEGDLILIGAYNGSMSNANLSNVQIITVKGTRTLFGEKHITFQGNLKFNYNQKYIAAYKLKRTFRHQGYNSTSEIIKPDSINYMTRVNVSFSRYLEIPTIPDQQTIRRIVEPPLSEFEFPLEFEVNDLSIGQTMVIEYQGMIPDNKIFVSRQIDKLDPVVMTWGSASGGVTKITFLSSLTGKSKPTPLTARTEVRAVQSKMADASSNNTEYLDAAPNYFFVDTNVYTDVVFIVDIETDIRFMKFYEVSGAPFVIGASVNIDKSTLNKLSYYGNYTSYQYLKNRAVQFVKDDISEEFLVTSIKEEINSDNAIKFREIVINKKLAMPLSRFTPTDFSLENPEVNVYGNLVEAAQGKTESETVLGNGDYRLVFQTFKLPKSPLTYYNSDSENPPEVPELQIFVNQRLWTRVPSFFNRESKEEIYIVREDMNGNSWIQFGDGKTGARLPSGINNITAKYRTGTGAYGNLKTGTVPQAGRNLNNLNKITLAGNISGGTEPEDSENARESAPGKIQSLGRLVSLKDYETETLAIAGVSKVSADWEIINNIPTVVLTVLMKSGREKEIDEVKKILENYNKCRGPQRFTIEVRTGKLRYVYIDADFGIQPGYRHDIVINNILKELGVSGDSKENERYGMFSIHQRRFGQKEYSTRIAGTIQNTEGVEWAKVNIFQIMEETDHAAKLIIPVFLSSYGIVISPAKNEILCLQKTQISLKSAAVEIQEVC